MTWTVISTSFQLRIHVVCLKGFSVWKTKINVKVHATYFVLFKFWLTEIPLKRVNFKNEIYNTMNSYHKYTSIPKSSFNKINILILPINTGEVSKIFHTLCLYLRLPAIMNLIFRTVRFEKFMTSCRDKLYHHTVSNKIKLNFHHLIQQNVLQQISAFVWHKVGNRKTNFEKFGL